MYRFKTTILILLLVPVVGYAALKLYLHSSVKYRLDQFLVQSQAFVQVTYGGVASDLRGSIGVEGIEIRVPGEAAVLRIGALWLAGDGPGFLLDIARGIGPDRLPDRLRLSLQRLRTGDPDTWLAVLGLDNNGAPAVTGDADRGCGLKALLAAAVPGPQGRWPAWLDLSLEYALERGGKQGSVDLRYEADGGQSLALKLSLAGVSRPLGLLTETPPQILGSSLSFRADRAYLSGRVAQCAAELGLSRSAYLDSLLIGADGALAAELGGVPGPGLRRTIKGYLMDPGEILLETGPIGDLAPAMAGDDGPWRLLSRQDTRLTVNGEPVRDLNFATVAAAPSRLEPDASEPGSLEPDAPEPLRPSFLETPLTDLEQYVGRDVRLFARDHDRPHRGVLVAVENQEASVERRLMRGKLTVHVPFADVERVLVLRYPDAVN